MRHPSQTEQGVIAGDMLERNALDLRLKQLAPVFANMLFVLQRLVERAGCV